MKVYISGPIKGIDDYEKLFLRVEEHLTDQGLEVVNPVTIPHHHEDTYEAYMKEDIKALLECDSIFMIWGWQESSGAKFEHDVAKKCGIEVMYGAHI